MKRPCAALRAVSGSALVVTPRDRGLSPRPGTARRAAPQAKERK